MTLQEIIRRQRGNGNPFEEEVIAELIKQKVDRVLAVNKGELEERFARLLAMFEKMFEREIRSFVNGLPARELEEMSKALLKKLGIVSKYDLMGAPGYTPVKGKDYTDGKPGKDGVSAYAEDVAPLVVPLLLEKLPKEQPDELVEKINNAKKKVLLSSIDGLESLIEELKTAIRRKPLLGGGGGTVTYKSLTGTINGTNTSFTVTSKPIHIVSDGIVYFEDNGYTRSGSAITMTVPPSQYARYAV